MDLSLISMDLSLIILCLIADLEETRAGVAVRRFEQPSETNTLARSEGFEPPTPRFEGWRSAALCRCGEAFAGSSHRHFIAMRVQRSLAGRTPSHLRLRNRTFSHSATSAAHRAR